MAMLILIYWSQNNSETHHFGCICKHTFSIGHQHQKIMLEPGAHIGRSACAENTKLKHCWWPGNIIHVSMFTHQFTSKNLIHVLDYLLTDFLLTYLITYFITTYSVAYYLLLTTYYLLAYLFTTYHLPLMYLLSHWLLIKLFMYLFTYYFLTHILNYLLGTYHLLFHWLLTYLLLTYWLETLNTTQNTAECRCEKPMANLRKP